MKRKVLIPLGSILTLALILAFVILSVPNVLAATPGYPLKWSVAVEPLYPNGQTPSTTISIYVEPAVAGQGVSITGPSIVVHSTDVADQYLNFANAAMLNIDRLNPLYTAADGPVNFQKYTLGRHGFIASFPAVTKTISTKRLLLRFGVNAKSAGELTVNMAGSDRSQGTIPSESVTPAVVKVINCPNNNCDSTETPTNCFTDCDADRDGVANIPDKCESTPVGSEVDSNGCAALQVDSDLDQVCDPDRSSAQWCPSGVDDACPSTPVGSTVDSLGCTRVQVDDDLDGLCTYGSPTLTELCRGVDFCPGTPSGKTVYPQSHTHAGCQLGDLNKNGCINLPDWNSFLGLLVQQFPSPGYSGAGDLNALNGLDLADWNMFLGIMSNDFKDC